VTEYESLGSKNGLPVVRASKKRNLRSSSAPAVKDRVEMDIDFIFGQELFSNPGEKHINV